MKAPGSEAFCEQFRAWVSNLIDSTRTDFQYEMRGEEIQRTKIYFGSRFNSNQDVFEAFVSGLGVPPLGLDFGSEVKRKTWATAWMTRLKENESEAKARVWDALKSAAEVDLYYDQEKSWR